MSYGPHIRSGSTATAAEPKKKALCMNGKSKCCKRSAEQEMNERKPNIKEFKSGW